MYTYVAGYPPKHLPVKSCIKGKIKKTQKAKDELGQGIMAGITKDFEDINPDFLVRVLWFWSFRK